MKRSLLLLQLFALLVAMSHWQAASAASGETRGAGYGFDSAKAYLETRSRDMTDFQSRFDNDVFQNLDAANAINLKYKTTPPEYVLYRLDLAKAIEGNAKKPEKLDALCRQFVAIDAAEKDYAAKIAAYNENLAEKFIPRDQYQLMDDDALREVLVTYLAGNSMLGRDVHWLKKEICTKAFLLSDKDNLELGGKMAPAQVKIDQLEDELAASARVLKSASRNTRRP